MPCETGSLATARGEAAGALRSCARVGGSSVSRTCSCLGRVSGGSRWLRRQALGRPSGCCRPPLIGTAAAAVTPLRTGAFSASRLAIAFVSWGSVPACPHSTVRVRDAAAPPVGRTLLRGFNRWTVPDRESTQPHTRSKTFLPVPKVS